MNYHNITTNDMLNGDGLRVVLWVSGCTHRCPGCQNPQTWDAKEGVLFDDAAKDEIFKELRKDYVDGITFSGGDPLFPDNRYEVFRLIDEIRLHFPNKTIWLYTGYKFEAIKSLLRMWPVDVLVDGPYVEATRDVNLHWRGSANQRVIDVKRSLEQNEIVLWD